MDTNERNAGSPMPARLSLLWVFILFNMVFADILSFMYPGFLKEVLTGYVGGVHITPGFLVAAAVLTEVPIAMILLSRVLRHRANRWANIVAGVITVAYVVGGSTRSPHGIFFSAMQVVCALLIVWYAWTWRSPEALTVPSALDAGIPGFRSCSMERGGDRVTLPWASGPAGEDAFAAEPLDRCRFIG